MGPRYLRNPDFVFRRIGTEVLLLPVRDKLGDLESIYSLNDVAARVWELLGEPWSLEDLRDRVVSEFEVDADRAHGDLADLVRDLAAIGGVREV